MFNLIVCNADWTSGRFNFPMERIFEYTADPLIAQFRNGTDPDFNAMRRIPVLFMEEGREDEIARVGRIVEVEVLRGREVTVTCTFEGEIPGIQNRVIEEMAAELQMADWEFTRNHWAIKDVDLFRALMRRNLRRRVGPQVFQIADHEAIEADLVSVMMPFAPQFDPVYRSLQEFCGGRQMRCVRADDIWLHQMVMQDVVSLIDRARVVIADCSGRNPNVFYEIGIAHTLGREVVLISQAEADVPFDLRHLRFVPYLNNAEGRAVLVQALGRRFEALGY